MATSIGFKEVTHKILSLIFLGLWMAMPRTNVSSNFDSSKLMLHIEIDQQDLPKRCYEAVFQPLPIGLWQQHVLGL